MRREDVSAGGGSACGGKREMGMVTCEENMKSVDDSGDLPSRKRYGKACENGLRGSEFHSLTVLVAVLVHRF